jgi:hypothetical protein
MEPNFEKKKIQSAEAPPGPGSNGGLCNHVVSNRDIESRCTPPCYRVVIHSLLSLILFERKLSAAVSGKYAEVEFTLKLRLKYLI